MTLESSVTLDHSALGALRTTGFVFFPQLAPHKATACVANHLGTVIDIPSTLQNSLVPTVQSIRPRHKEDSPSNIYSGTYGTGEFPLHTDLAHWLVPPRYLLLRCLHGTPAVATTLLDITSFIGILGEDIAKGAIVRPRRPHPFGSPGPLTVIFHRSSTLGVRWDRLFLSPVNLYSREAVNKMACMSQATPYQKTIVFEDCGDTLLIDNWRCLHGRSPVPAHGAGRRIERTFLSRVG